MSAETTTGVDAYLTRIADRCWSRAIVYKAENGAFILSKKVRKGNDVIKLGPTFSAARVSLMMMIKNENEKLWADLMKEKEAEIARKRE